MCGLVRDDKLCFRCDVVLSSRDVLASVGKSRLRATLGLVCSIPGGMFWAFFTSPVKQLSSVQPPKPGPRPEPPLQQVPAALVQEERQYQNIGMYQQQLPPTPPAFPGGPARCVKMDHLVPFA